MTVDGKQEKEGRENIEVVPLRWEMHQQYPHLRLHSTTSSSMYSVGVSRETPNSIKELVGVRADKILLDMQKAVTSSTLNIARSFKVLTA